MRLLTSLDGVGLAVPWLLRWQGYHELHVCMFADCQHHAHIHLRGARYKKQNRMVFNMDNSILQLPRCSDALLP